MTVSVVIHLPLPITTGYILKQKTSTVIMLSLNDAEFGVDLIMKMTVFWNVAPCSLVEIDLMVGAVSTS
jgi:hypothetical protein